jgi:hypothetical protein
MLGVLSVGGVWFLLDSTSTVFLLGFGIYTWLPWGFLALNVKTLSERARWAALAMLVVTASVTYLSVAATASSTEVLAFFFLPAYQWVAIGVIWLIAVTRRRQNRDRRRGLE